jgi:hypothetical protein
MKLIKTPERRAQETIPMQYPTPIEIEQSLQRFADWRYDRITVSR